MALPTVLIAAFIPQASHNSVADSNDCDFCTLAVKCEIPTLCSLSTVCVTEWENKNVQSANLLTSV